MKKVICFLAVLLLSLNSFSQTTKSPEISKDDYLRKSKIQNIAGWAFAGVGGSLIIAGVLVQNSIDDNNGQLNFDFSGIFISAIGIGAALGSIPFFVRSSKNARSAAKISFKNQKILFPQHNNLVVKSCPSITLKIGL